MPHVVHGHSLDIGGRSAEYIAWDNMIQRCTNPKRSNYQWYGGRGIKVCDRWLRFEAFLAGVGPRPSPQHSLDRFPNNAGDYEPGNVRWATMAEQHRNKRDNLFIEYDGCRLTQAEWARRIGIPAGTLSSRITRGWKVHRALTYGIDRQVTE